MNPVEWFLDLPGYARFLFAFTVPFVAVLIATPLAIRVARRAGIMDHPASHKAHGEATPYLGGVAVGLGLALFSTWGAQASIRITAVLGTALAMGILGLVDDLKGLGPVPKLSAEFLGGVVLYLAGVRVELFGVPVLDLLLTTVWVMTVVNAVNLLDNSDGIAAGVVSMCALGFAAIAGTNGNLLIMALATAIMGASLGFLRYNAPPAKIFLGDAGSLMLGFLLAAISLGLNLVGRPGVVRVAIPILVLAVPLFDMAVVMTARLRAGRPLYQGGMDHSAHRLLKLGVRPRRLVLIAMLAQASCSAAGLFLSRAADLTVLIAWPVAIAIGVATLVFLIRLEGAEERDHVPAMEQSPDIAGLSAVGDMTTGALETEA
jgi:UDP-GlcNAc:undecaprenyl-phosphate GlcNAc-1-phosphate transferase